jgi:hypothetical protein
MFLLNGMLLITTFFEMCMSPKLLPDKGTEFWILRLGSHMLTYGPQKIPVCFSAATGHFSFFLPPPPPTFLLSLFWVLAKPPQQKSAVVSSRDTALQVCLPANQRKTHQNSFLRISLQQQLEESMKRKISKKLKPKCKNLKERNERRNNGRRRRRRRRRRIVPSNLHWISGERSSKAQKHKSL